MKYILAIDSLINTFSYVECSEDVLFKYEDKNGIVLSDALKAGDLLLIYKKRPSASIKMLMEVK